MSRGDIAVSMAIRDWAVFPLKPMSKAPATRSGFYAGTTDLVTIRRYWSQKDWNIGIWCGESRLVVIDFDIKPEKGDPGITWWLTICDAAGFDPEATYNVTTPRGGMHAYFVSDELYPPRVGWPAPNVDIRAGLSYVAGHGSETELGMYEHFGADSPIEMPRWLHLALEPRVVEVKSALVQKAADTKDGYRPAVEGIYRVLRDAIEGERNNTLNWAVWKVGQHYWSETQREEAVERLRQIAIESGVDSDKPGQTDATIRSTRAKWPAR